MRTQRSTKAKLPPLAVAVLRNVIDHLRKFRKRMASRSPSLSWHSHTVRTAHPCRRSDRVTRACLIRFLARLLIQYSTFDLGVRRPTVQR